MKLTLNAAPKISPHAVTSQCHLQLVQNQNDAPELLQEELERVLLGVGIPPRPEILTQLSMEAKKDAPNFGLIEKLISADVGISAALIKTVNSPFYGLRSKTHSVKDAINFLGLNTLLRIISGMMLKKAFPTSNQINMERFWDASAKVALVSAYIAKQLPGMHKDEAYTFGLFQDCGIPLLMMRFDTYKETLNTANHAERVSFTQVENDIHGVSHNTVGYLLAKSWGLPDSITQAIRFHHEHFLVSEDRSLLSVESQNLIGLALLAERAIQINTHLDQTVEWEKCGAHVLDHFALSDSDFKGMVEDVGELLHEEA